LQVAMVVNSGGTTMTLIGICRLMVLMISVDTFGHDVILIHVYQVAMLIKYSYLSNSLYPLVL